MARKANNKNNAFVKGTEDRVDEQPWNKSQIEIEPSQDQEGTPASPEGRYNDKIKIAPTDDQGRATPRAIKNWREGLKRA